MMKKQFLVFCLVFSIFTIHAQIASFDNSEVLVMLIENEASETTADITQSSEKHSDMDKLVFFRASSKMSKNKSVIKFEIKDKKIKKHLFWDFLFNSSNISVDRYAHINKRQMKCFGLNSKNTLTKHLKHLEIINGVNCENSVMNEPLYLNLPQRSNYKISTIQGEEILKGTVQESAINIGKLPVGVYLLEAWNIGKYQKDKVIKK